MIAASDLGVRVRLDTIRCQIRSASSSAPLQAQGLVPCGILRMAADPRETRNGVNCLIQSRPMHESCCMIAHLAIRYGCGRAIDAQALVDELEWFLEME